MSDQKEYTKDPILMCKSTKISKDKKGNDRIELSLSQEDAVKLIEAATKLLDNPRGVKLDVHVTTRTSQAGKEFNGAYFFVKGIADPATFAQKKFVSKAPAAFDVSAKIAQLKAGLNKPVA